MIMTNYIINRRNEKKEGLKTVVDWWAASVKLLGNPRLL